MKRVLVLLFALLSSSAHAQSIPFPGPGAASASYTGPADINGAPSGFWGLRAMSAALATTSTSLADLVAVTGGAAVCTLRASSTGVDLTGSYCSSTTPALACAAASGGSCVISKLYDQSGAGNHLTQATQASRPPITFNTWNGNPVISISGTSYLLFGGSLTVAQPFTVSMVMERTAGSTFGRIFDDNSNLRGVYVVGANTWSITAVNGSAGSSFTANDSAIHSLQALFNNASSSAYVDGTANTGLNIGASTSFGTLPVAGRGVAGITAFYSEIGIWSGDKTANNATMCHNQRLFWGTAGSC